MKKTAFIYVSVFSLGIFLVVYFINKPLFTNYSKKGYTSQQLKVLYSTELKSNNNKENRITKHLKNEYLRLKNIEEQSSIEKPDKTKINKTKKIKMPSTFEAELKAKKFIKSKLKNQSSAKFRDIRSNKTIKYVFRPDEDIYEVSGIVNATNSFGARIDTKFLIKMKYNGNWEIVSFSM